MSADRVLVTGAGGFIGRHVVRDQLARGRRVRALDRDAGILNLFPATERLQIVPGDIVDSEVQRQAVDGVDVVFHLASAHLERAISAEQFRRTNVDAVASLLRESRSAGVRRFVQVSSCGVHGRVDNHPADENAPFRPEVAYERTKLTGEQLAAEYGRREGLPVVVVRPAWVYGPECRRTTRLIRSVAAGRFVMIGNGKARRGSIYVSDFVDAMDLCANSDAAAGEAFIIVHDEPVTVRSIVDEISRLAGVSGPRIRLPVWSAWILAAAAELSFKALQREPPISRRSLKFFTNDASFTSAKARKMLGFQPRVRLAEGLERTYRWWRNGGGGH